MHDEMVTSQEQKNQLLDQLDNRRKAAAAGHWGTRPFWIRRGRKSEGK